jgi:hypothetical protein
MIEVPWDLYLLASWSNAQTYSQGYESMHRMAARVSYRNAETGLKDEKRNKIAR